jgi:ubiquinone/menaquinone biosynthesis C-methylase UbiE
MSDILDLGCGSAKLTGAVGIDVRPGPGVDIVHDLNKFPWPIEDNRFDTVRCSHVLEHLVDLPAVLTEIHRISKAGAKVKIVTPHFSSLNSWEDPTHIHHFARRSFDFFDTESRHHYTSVRLKTVTVDVTFGGGVWDFFGRVQYDLFPDLWEKHFAFTFRARNLEIELEVVK